MHLETFLITIFLTARTASAAVALVHNKCDFPIWVTDVGTDQDATIYVHPGGGYWVQQQYQPSADVGVAIKITRTEKSLYEKRPVLHFSYSLITGSRIYYDLSTYNGFDFRAKKLRIHGEDGKKVEEIVWTGEPKPNHTVAYVGTTDLTLELCE